MSLKLTHGAVDRLIARGNPLSEEEVADTARRPEAGALLTHILDIDPQDPDDDVLDRLGWTRQQLGGARRSGRRIAVLVVAAAVVALVGGILSVTEGGISQPFTTKWQVGEPLRSQGMGELHHRSGTWTLANDLLSGTWQQNASGPPVGYHTCPTAGTCYMMSGHYASTQALSPTYESVYVSTDVGTSWTELPMPQGFVATSGISCGGPTTCAAGGTYNGQPVLASTTDGGHSFTVAPLPAGVGSLYAISCPTMGFCAGLAATSDWSATPSQPRDATFLRTTDGGTTFTDLPILAGDSMMALDCSSNTDCTVVGTTDASLALPSSATTPAMPVGVAARTSDAGHTWQVGRLPRGFGTRGPLHHLACVDALHCFVTGVVPIAVGNQPGCQVSFGHSRTVPGFATSVGPQVWPISEQESQLATNQVGSLSPRAKRTSGPCTSTHPSTSGDIASTTDGGLTWTPEVMPTSAPQPLFSGLSCPTSTECWASGEDSVAHTVGITQDGSSPVLLGTTDGGQTWSTTTFHEPSSAPNYRGQSYISMGSITCPSAAVCLAVGMTAEGAPNAPVYSLVDPNA